MTQAPFDHTGSQLTGDKKMKVIKVVDDVVFFSVMGVVLGIGTAYALSKIIIEKVNPLNN